MSAPRRGAPPRPRSDAPPRSRLRPRRALAVHGGAVDHWGDPGASRLLESALQAATPSDQGAELTHGFHGYPARMHPGIARALVATFGAPAQRLLDPFCGSGSVLIEAMVAGLRCAGVDLNPLATWIAAVQCELRDAPARTRFEGTLVQVGEASLARVRAREPARAPLSARERAHYEPHVLLELAGLHAEIGLVADEADRRALLVVFSSLLVKFSRQRADTSDEHVVKRIRKGLVSEFFMRKGAELSRRWAALRKAAPRSAREPLLVTGDARELPALLGGGARADLVVSSPPYGGTYDYHAHHARRYPWLGLSAATLEQREIGARRRLSRPRDAAAHWDRELAACLRAIAAVCRTGARVVLLIGDAQVGGTRIDARAQLGKLAPPAGLRLLAGAAQVRPDRLGGVPRREHLLLLVRSG